jgi:hypothetical protein
MEPANGKIGEKGCIITVWWRRNSRIMTGPNTSCIPFGKPKSRFSYRLCLSLWLIQDSNWKGDLFGDYLEVSQQFFKTGFHVMNKK